jgi:hypothetical protein
MPFRPGKIIMSSAELNVVELKPVTREFYQRALKALDDDGVPFLVCGAFALQAYTQIIRRTKDLDIFVQPADRVRALTALSRAGFSTEITFPHWLAKAYCNDDFVDVIFSSGNGMCPVDATWFAHAVGGEIFGRPVKLCPVEEILWQKSFIMERERYDGADVAHLLRACGKGLDWQRLLDRFGPHWPVLLNHLILFGFIYPGERSVIPAMVLRDLLGRQQCEVGTQDADDRLCRGPILSREQYLVDIERWGYHDARLRPLGNMSAQEIDLWTKPVRQ